MQIIAHTGANNFNIVVKVMDLPHSGWKPILHAVTSDGAPLKTGVLSGLYTRLKNLCEEVHSGFPILMIRCSRHPLNVKQNNDLIMLDTSIAFRPILNGLIGYLQKSKTF